MERLSAEDYLAALRRLAGEDPETRKQLGALELMLRDSGIAVGLPIGDAPPAKN